MCAPSPPPPPDYAGAAVAQGAANRDAAIATGRISNPWITNPYGTRKVLYNTDPNAGPYSDVPSIVEELSPEQQKIFDINQQGQENLATVGRDATARVGGILGQDVNFNRDLGTQAQGRQQVIDAMMSRYDTDLGRRKDQTASDLIARGIPRGSEAWNREMELMDRGRNDALQQATISADAKSMDERRQAITELMAQRQTPLNEISALRSGSQVAPLQFQPYSGATVQPAPVFQGAVQQGNAQADAYNASAANSGNMIGGLFKLGAAAIPMFSDRRLKSNVVRIGTHTLGVGLYAYDIFGRRDIGVMADEVLTVRPAAVHRHASGYLIVDYGALT